MNTQKLVRSGILCAVYIALSYVSINTPFAKISFALLPVIIGSIFLDRWYGFGIGLVGCFIKQLLTYGFGVTTVLWCLPISICGFASKYIYNKSNSCFFICVIDTVLNTVMMCVDASVYGYFNWNLILISLPIRIIMIIFYTLVYDVTILECLKGCKNGQK